MIEQDTIKLLRECDAGVKMGISSIEDVLPYAKNKEFESYLSRCKKEHEELEREIHMLLLRYRDEGKEPNLMAEVMSWMKTSVKMTMDNSDETIADLMTDGLEITASS